MVCPLRDGRTGACVPVVQGAAQLLGLVLDRPFGPRRYVAVYPEIVETISLYASPHWRRLALADDEAAFRQFKAGFNRRLPQERALRTTARAWFLTELKRTAMRIDAATQ